MKLTRKLLRCLRGSGANGAQRTPMLALDEHELRCPSCNYRLLTLSNAVFCSNCRKPVDSIRSR